MEDQAEKVEEVLLVKKVMLVYQVKMVQLDLTVMQATVDKA